MKNYTKKDRYQMVTDAVLKLMQEHGADWSKPWQAQAGNCHHNVTTGKAYKGTNIFMTAISAFANGFTSNEWATYKQWQAKGATVRKGQKGTDIVFFDKIVIEDSQTGDRSMVPILKGFCIFNADQVDGYDAKPIANQTRPSFSNTGAESLIAATGAIIKHGGDKAFYAPQPDYIQMPDKADFQGTADSTAEQSYYSTMCHELTHWTGHKSRLDRKLIGRFGSNAYAFEELIAETGAAFLCAMLGLEKQPTPDHAKYLNNWLEVLKQDKRAMMKAFGQAQKACDYILATQQHAIAAE